MSAPELTNQAPHTVGKYQILATLGKGGMATVYLAVVRGLVGFNKLVVLKVMRTADAQDPDLVAMFMNEACLAARLSHPNVVQTNEVGDEGGTHFLAMEYLDGQPHSKLMTDQATMQEKLTLPMHLRVISDALAGLHYAHELKDYDDTPLNIVHRDVSPHNIFVTYDGQIKIIDFGIAKTSVDEVNTATGIVKGKLAYMAPEQVLCMPPDRRADVYSVGVILWEAIAGRKMRNGAATVARYQAIITEDAPSPREHAPDVAPELERICAKALARDPDHRYATAAEMRVDLEAFLVATNKLVTGHDVGQHLARHFADRRTRFRRIVEQRMARGVSSSEIIADRSLTSTSGSGSGSGGRTTRVPEDSKSDDLKTDEPSSQSAIATVTPQTANHGGRGLRLVVAGAAVVLLAVAGGVTFMQTNARVGREALAARKPPASEPINPEPKAPKAAETVTLNIASSPASAQMFIDDVPVSSNPDVREVPKDGRVVHRIRVEAKGYATEVRETLFDRELHLVFTLNKADMPAPAPVAAAYVAPPRGQQQWRPPTPTPAQPTPAQPTPAVGPSPQTAPQTAPATTAAVSPTVRPLDTKNPWEK